MRSLFGSLACLVCLAVFFTSIACKKSTPPPPTVGGCPGSDPGPSFRIGSQNLTPTFAVIGTTQVVSKTLIVAMNGAPSLQLDVGGPMIGDDFEMCVVTNPPAPKTHLGVDVTGVLEDPSGSPASGPVNYWQTLFAAFFVNPLQNNQTDSNGVLKIDVSAQNLRSDLANTPVGYNSGRMLITVTLNGGPRKLDLTLVPQ